MPRTDRAVLSLLQGQELDRPIGHCLIERRGGFISRRGLLLGRRQTRRGREPGNEQGRNKAVFHDESFQKGGFSESRNVRSAVSRGNETCNPLPVGMQFACQYPSAEDDAIYFPTP